MEDIEYLERCQKGEEVGPFGGGDLKYTEKVKKRLVRKVGKVKTDNKSRVPRGK